MTENSTKPPATTESERVYVAITELIRANRFAAGEALRETAIATELNVSRTPVREALRRLSTEGTVEIIPNRGATLVHFSENDIADIWSLRSLLEPYAARLAAERADETNVARLESLWIQMQEALDSDDLDLLTELNNQFHGEIVNAGRSRVLRDALAAVQKKVLVRQTFGHYSQAQLLRSHQHHRDLVDAIAAGNNTWAESTMRAHIEAGQEVK